MLAFVGNGRVRLQNRRLRDRTGVYPEAASLARVFADSVIIDGEFVYFVGDHPSFPALLKRELASTDHAQGALERYGPITFCVFDVLYARGGDVRNWPWQKRDELLHELMRDGELPGDRNHDSCRLYLVESFEDPQALWEATERLELEGIVVKQKDSPYVAGKHHHLWWKCKHRRRQLAQVIGFSHSGPFVTSLALGALDDGNLKYIGNAGSGLSRDVASLLYRELMQDQRPEPPTEVPRGILGVSTWVHPRLVAEIEFLEWTPEGQLRHPVIVDFPQALLDDCVLDGS